jgi:hypothetical protein
VTRRLALPDRTLLASGSATLERWSLDELEQLWSREGSAAAVGSHRADPALVEVRLLAGRSDGTWRIFTEGGRFLVEPSLGPEVGVTELATGIRYRAATRSDHVNVLLADPGELWVKGTQTWGGPSRLVRVALPAPQEEAASLGRR